jgi:hypothetical protein
MKAKVKKFFFLVNTLKAQGVLTKQQKQEVLADADS